MTAFLKILNKPIYKHLLFWVVVYIFYSSSAFQGTYSTASILISNILHTFLQVIVAYSILLVIIPRYKKNSNIFESILLLIVLFIIVQIFASVVKMFFLEVTFPSCFADSRYVMENTPFIERLTDFKVVFIYNPFFYLQPLFFLGALLSYEKQQKLSEIKEQKKTVELNALKHQLNPHFLFNTLNNLYTLTLEKSDAAPEAIAKLSGILDYTLYRCDDKYVAIEKEIEMIENYLALEQIRYEDRVTISFKNTVTESVKIAPLLLLTFLENAFKHGVSQELEMARVNISIALDKNDIIFTIFNTKPQVEIKKPLHKKRIGLSNIEKQLALLYPGEHKLSIDDNDKTYEVILKLKQR